MYFCKRLFRMGILEAEAALDLHKTSEIGAAMFDKSSELFPIKKNCIYLSHCGVSPLYSSAVEKELEISAAHRDTGAHAFIRYEFFLNRLHLAAASMLKTGEENIAFVKNASEAISMIANGYPFEEGDQIISYVHEYPANHYPWRLQELRGAQLLLLPNRNDAGENAAEPPCAWSMSDLEEAVTARTKIVALSHVQFTSGFAANLKLLGDFCRSRGIDLVIDAAQSLGSLPIYPEEYSIAAIASSGWKWLLGPVGTGLLYTSQEFRDKLGHVLVGAEVMLQGTDYLNHAWQPHRTARRFEYSTSPIALAVALEACIAEIALSYGLEAISAEIFRLQDIILKEINRDYFTPVEFPAAHRSGILSVVCREDPISMVKGLGRKGVICSARGGYLRLAPHFYNTDDEIQTAIMQLNQLGYEAWG
jgi:cysteine desulfurase / selenocysteine lyase